MKLRFTGKTDIRSDALETMCQKKLEKIESKFASKNEMNADITFGTEGGDFVLSIVLTADGNKFIAKSKNRDMYANIDDCVKKLNSQIGKTKTGKKNVQKEVINEQPEKTDVKGKKFADLIDKY